MMTQNKSEKEFSNDEIRSRIETDNWTVGTSQKIMIQQLAENERLKKELEGLERFRNLRLRHNDELERRTAENQSLEQHLMLITRDYREEKTKLLTKINRLTEGNTRLRKHLNKAIDTLVLPGHGFAPTDWKDACLLSGSYCEPYLSWNKDKESEIPNCE